MRMLLFCAWLLIPVGFGIWHYGPGQEYMARDAASRALAKADALVAEENYKGALEFYDEALKLLPAKMVDEARRVRVEKAKAQMRADQLPDAHAELKVLVEEMLADTKADKKVLTDARSAMAQSQYYMAWLMRLEGMQRDLWEPEVEASRQTYRLLAEEAATKRDEAAATQHKEDLEASVRLARMELDELQGLPLPCQCSGCCSGKKPGGKPGKTPAKKTGEKKDARGASSGPPPDTTGH